MKVAISVTCSRTGRPESREMTIEEAAEFQTALTTRFANTREFEEEAGKLTTQNNQPDLIVSYKGKAVALAVIGVKSHDPVMRLLAELTKREDIFPKPEVKSRSKSTSTDSRDED